MDIGFLTPGALHYRSIHGKPFSDVYAFQGHSKFKTVSSWLAFRFKEGSSSRKGTVQKPCNMKVSFLTTMTEIQSAEKHRFFSFTKFWELLGEYHSFPEVWAYFPLFWFLICFRFINQQDIILFYLFIYRPFDLLQTLYSAVFFCLQGFNPTPHRNIAV